MIGQNLRPDDTDCGRNGRSKVPDAAVGDGGPPEVIVVGVDDAEDKGEERQGDGAQRQAPEGDH